MQTKRMIAVLAASLMGSLAFAQDVPIATMTLEDMYQAASKNNQQLKLLAAGIEVSQNVTEMARAARLPKLSGSASLSYLGDGLVIDRDFGHASTAPMPHFGNSLALEASQVVYAGGAISEGIEKAKLEEQVARLGYAKDQQAIRFLLSSLYLDVWKLRNQRTVYVKNREREEAVVRQMQARLQEGAALANDVLRHELVLRHLELALIQLDNGRRIMNNQLTTLLGLPASTVVEPDTSALRMVGQNPSEEDLLKTAKSSLPELKLSEMMLNVAEKEVSIAKAGYFPTVALFAGDQLNGPITIEIPAIDKNYNAWYVGVCLKYEISSLYLAGRSVRLAQGKRAMASREQSLAQERAELAIRNGLIKYRESFEELRVLEKGCEFARSNYDVVAERHANGVVLVTEMIDAADSRLDAELKLVDARINTVFQSLNLKRLSGTL